MELPQQIELQKKIPNLILKWKCELERIPGDHLSSSQKMFTLLCEKYPDGRSQRFVQANTGISPSTFQAYKGNGKKASREAVKGESNLLKLVFCWGTTTEEAVVYFYFCGKNLLCDDLATIKLFSIILELDQLYDHSTVEERMVILYEMAEKYGFSLR